MRWDAEIESIRRSKGAIVVIYTVTFSPTLDYVVSVDHFRTGIINRTTSEHAYPGGKGVNVSIALKNFGFDKYFSFNKCFINKGFI